MVVGSRWGPPVCCKVVAGPYLECEVGVILESGEVVPSSWDSKMEEEARSPRVGRAFCLGLGSGLPNPVFVRYWDGRVIVEMEIGTRIVVRWYGCARAVGWHDKLAERPGENIKPT